MLQLYTNVQRMKQLMCFNQWVNNFILVSTVSFHIIYFINKDMLIYFISGKMLLQHNHKDTDKLHFIAYIYCICTPHM